MRSTHARLAKPGDYLHHKKTHGYSAHLRPTFLHHPHTGKTSFVWGKQRYVLSDATIRNHQTFTIYADSVKTMIGLRNGGVMVLGNQSNGINASRTPTKTATPTP
jgi:hypothetical protein